ncbi:MAG: DNA repair protein RecN [Treponema sp.]|jgi:DNA repair protein RecN (Recombination protein N)|nr:DNA repair protein RecN [Treponema sp.]
MLEEITIRNYALVDSLNQSFEAGFNVLTGETGAGKSIIVGSLSFLMGAKAEPDVIRSGCDEASVSAVVQVSPHNAEALAWLAERDIALDDGRVIIRRNLKATGRSAMYIQNVSVPRADLEAFCHFLFDLHGQHSHESLLRKETHRVYLDRFGGIEDEARAFYRGFVTLTEKRKLLEASLNSERDRDARLELLRYGVEELGKAALRPGESRELEAEAQRLGDFERLLSHVNAAAEALFEGEDSALSRVRKARLGIEASAAIDQGLAGVLKRMEDLYYEAEDLSAEFRSYRDALSFDPDRLEEVEERLALIQRLARKHLGASAATAGDRESALLAWKAGAEKEIEALAGAGESRDTLKQEIAALEKGLSARAQALSAKRKEAAKRLGEGITRILGRLGMPRAAFAAAVNPKGQGGRLVLGPWGADDVEFLISANAGEPLKDLARIASGGELSRVMLAIKTILLAGGGHQGGAASQVTPDESAETLVFDEIDTGIGGEVALSVGEYLAQIGACKQIFCVTHLASIAVRASHHLKVQKRVEGDRTVTGLSLLEKEERRQEIARMLAGDAGGAALAHADDLLEKYGGPNGGK